MRGLLAARLESTALSGNTLAVAATANTSRVQHYFGPMKGILIGLGAAVAVVGVLGFARAPEALNPPDGRNPASLLRGSADDTVPRVSMRQANFYVIRKAALGIRPLRRQMVSL